MAKSISEKSPIAVISTKHLMNRESDPSLEPCKCTEY